MRRIISLVVVALLMAAMVVAMSVPAFATQPLEDNPNSNSQGVTNAQASSLVKHNGPVVSEQAQREPGARSDLVHACNAQSDPTACG
jgi:hypothetical protein